jgi:isopentenyl-diphosphate delta-isomerase
MPDRLTAQRKDQHLDLCATEQVEPKTNSTLFECVRLLHCAMPELAVDEIRLASPFMGKTLRAPLLLTGMTGGTDRAGEVNRDLALAAEQHGVAFGVGSQRAMSEDETRAKSFQVRDVAPTAVILGNIGMMQAVTLGVPAVERLAELIGADGMALHLNAGQELTQPEGDRDFRGGYKIVEALVKAFGDRLIVKETGCGISPEVARRLSDLGVKNLDVSGLGGTSWVKVEQLRARGVEAEVGAAFASWGIPTAAAVALARKVVAPEVRLVASGGMRDGHEAAKALALGADLVGAALPIFRAQQQGGAEGAARAVEALIVGIRNALVLTGSRDVALLRRRPRVITGDLKDWLSAV